MSLEQSKVAIIGGGWAGLQLLQSLKELKIKADLFDRQDVVGGTWSPNVTYVNLSLHSPRWVNHLMRDGQLVPFQQKSQEFLDRKANAQEMHAYLTDYARTNGLMSNIECNAVVSEVLYDSSTRKAELVIERPGGEPVRRGPYDLVVYSSMCGKPLRPDIPDDGFAGQVIHSSEFKEATLQGIVSNGSKVLVLGAGKSGTDIMMALQQASHENVTWLFRQPYWFFKYEVFFHNRSCLAALRGLLCLVCMVLMLISSTLSMFLLWAIGYIEQPGKKGLPAHFDAKKFNFGVLDKQQRDFARRVRPVIGDPSHLSPDGMVLKNGETIKCDVVIYGTGFATGLGDLRCFKDGQLVDVCDKALYDHVACPCLPCLLVAPTFFIHFGPLRGVTLAQYVSYFLEKTPTEEIMMSKAKRNFCVQKSTQFIGFGSKTVCAKQWLLMYVDWITGGILNPYAFIKVAIELFVCGKYAPIKLRVGGTDHLLTRNLPCLLHAQGVSQKARAEVVGVAEDGQHAGDPAPPAGECAIEDV